MRISRGMEYEPSKIQKSEESSDDSDEFNVLDELVEQPTQKTAVQVSVLNMSEKKIRPEPKSKLEEIRNLFSTDENK